MTGRAVVRPRRRDDVPALLAALTRTHASDRYPILAAHVEDPRWLLQPDGPAWVAEVDGAVVGQAALSRGADEAILRAAAIPRDTAWTVTRLFVDPAVRGSGAGTALLAAVEDHADAVGSDLSLEVVEHNAAARALYLARGWQELGSYGARWFGDDGPVFRAHRFVRFRR